MTPGLMKKYTGNKPPARFVDPVLAYSGEVCLTYRSMENLLQYCLNYILSDPTYSEESRNCQTFAADFFSFLCAKKKVKPFYHLNQIFYIPKQTAFLYDPNHLNDEDEEDEEHNHGSIKNLSIANEGSNL